MNFNKSIESIFDLSEKSPPLRKTLTSLLKTKLSKKGLKGPWKHDFKNHCIKCGKVFHLQKHHITYQPELVVFLCVKCHKQITMLNTIGSAVAGGSLKHRPNYTNRLRITLWRWFSQRPSAWPVNGADKPVKKLTNSFVLSILKKKRFKIEVQPLEDKPDKCLLKNSPTKTHLNVEPLPSRNRRELGVFGETYLCDGFAGTPLTYCVF